jgi:hypothetical protein
MWHIWGRGAYRDLVGIPEGWRPLGTPTRRLEDNIKINFREVGKGAWLRIGIDDWLL